MATPSVSGSLSSRTPPPPVELEYDPGPRSFTVNGRSTTQADANAAIAGHGLTVDASGALRTADGFDIDSLNANVVTDFGGNAPLPDVTGSGVGSGTLNQRMMWLTDFSDGALMWEQMSELARSGIRDMKDARDFRDAMQLQKVQAKQAQINATEKQIDAERKAAFESMMWSVAGAVVSGVAGGMTAGSTSAVGMGIQAAAPALGQAVSATGNYISKAHGGQREADEQRLKSMRWEREEAMIDQMIEEARSAYEDAKEEFKLAMKIIAEHEERNSQVVQKVTSS